MRVTGVKTFLVSPASHLAGMIGGKNLLFVKIETDSGIVGWGEAYTQLDRDRNIERHVQDLVRYLIGREVCHIRHFTHMVMEDFAGRRGAMDLYSALSALEQALWDAWGKRLGEPVYNLLGGPCRERLRVYANGWYGGARTPDDYAQKAAETVARGFTALKFDPFPGPWRLYITPEVEDRAIENVRAVREAVGPQVDLLIEGHRRLAPMHAVRIGERLAPYAPFWYEEPVPADNVAALAEVRHQVRIPIVTGETLYTKAAFVPILEARAADILNPDVCNCGGILELKEIAAMAEPHLVALAPHNYNSVTIGLAATLQASACMPNFIITEYFVNFEETGHDIAVNPLRVEEGGYIALPKAPGLGMELDEARLAAWPYREYPPRNLPRLEV